MQVGRIYRVVGQDGRIYPSKIPGVLGGNRRTHIYGTLNCPAALRVLKKGGYKTNRVFFHKESVAIAAGYRPCAICMPERYRQWKEAQILAAVRS